MNTEANIFCAGLVIGFALGVVATVSLALAVYT